MQDGAGSAHLVVMGESDGRRRWLRSASGERKGGAADGGGSRRQSDREVTSWRCTWLLCPCEVPCGPVIVSLGGESSWRTTRMIRVISLDSCHQRKHDCA